MLGVAHRRGWSVISMIRTLFTGSERFSASLAQDPGCGPPRRRRCCSPIFLQMRAHTARSHGVLTVEAVTESLMKVLYMILTVKCLLLFCLHTCS